MGQGTHTSLATRTRPPPNMEDYLAFVHSHILQTRANHCTVGKLIVNRKLVVNVLKNK